MVAQFKPVRNIRRFRKIVAVFARHGFGAFFEQLKSQQYLPVPPSFVGKPDEAEYISPAVHFRLALEELGPTFIKLGQILSTRPDIFPRPYIAELIKLQDQVPPTPWEKMQSLLQKEYGENLVEIFAEIDPEPIGSASLAQVHTAKLMDGRQVVLKIQRPSILPIIETDLEVLLDLAAIAQRTSWGKLYNPVEIVTQFSFTLQNELDFRREGANADRFRINFSAEDQIKIPEIHWEYLTRRVLVMEQLSGIKIDQFEQLDQAGIDRQALAQLSANFLVKEVMQDGFFHADPHAGNFVVIPGDTPTTFTIGAMDFGMVGYISKTDRMNIIQSVVLLTRLDSKGIVDHMLRIGAISSETDLVSLERDVSRMLGQYYGLPIKKIQTRRLMEELMQIAFQYHVKLPADFWLLAKALIMMDGLARRLDPDFDVFSSFEPAIRQVLSELRSPWNLGTIMLKDLESLALSFRDVPGIIEKLIRSLQHGSLPLSMELKIDKHSMNRLDRITTRLSLSVLITAFIMGQALLFPLVKDNTRAHLFVISGFIITLVLGIWLAISFLRTGK